MEIEQIIIFGVGSPIAIDVEETCRRLGLNVAAAVKNVEGQNHLSSRVPVLEPDRLPRHLLTLPVTFPMFTPAHRKKALQEALDRGFSRPAQLIDPTCVVASSATLGAGVFVNAGCTIGGATTLRDFVFVNRSASIGHHCVLEEFVSVGPAAVLAGQVRIERGAVVCTGAVILPEMRIGANAVVGAGAVVTRPVPAGCLVFGNPARVVRRSIAGYKGLPV